MELTKYQIGILDGLIRGAHIEIIKTKNGIYRHYIIESDNRKTRIRSDTSKAIQRWVKQKIIIKK